MPGPAGRDAVLITRPEPGASETARAVAALGWRPVLAPVLRLSPVPLAIPRVQAVLLASRAAARGLAAGAPALPAFAVGPASAGEARRAGFASVEAAEGDAAALVRLVIARLKPAGGPLLLAVGRGYGAEIAAPLRAAGFRVIRRVAYEARPIDALPPDAVAALAAGAIGHALFLSPLSARVAQRLIAAAGLSGALARSEALVLSSRIAAMLRPAEWGSVRVASRPEASALLELLGERPGARGG